MKISVEHDARQNDEHIFIKFILIIIRRKISFLFMLFSFFSLGVVYSISTASEYEYTSVIQIAENNKEKPLESANLVVENIRNRWLPEVESQFFEVHERNKYFDISIANPENTSLIKISSGAATEFADDVRFIHNGVVEKIKFHQDKVFASEKSSLTKQIESLDNLLGDSEKIGEFTEGMGFILEKKLELEKQLTKMSPLEVIFIARKSNQEVGHSKTLSIIFSLVSGIVLSLLGVLIIELFRIVRSIAGKSKETELQDSRIS